MKVDEENAAQVGKITLIGILHNPLGQCHVDALCSLLEALAPEVIFEEWRPVDVTARDSDTTWQSLDRQAIARYVQGRIIQQVPVDSYDLPPEFRQDVDRLFDYVIAHSPEYPRLQRIGDEEAFQYGFAYLNSPPWVALCQRLQVVLEDTIAESGDSDLQKILTTWTTLVRQREVAMVDNIYAYTREHIFKAGVFLVGAAHISAIANIISTRPASDQGLIVWDFGCEH